MTYSRAAMIWHRSKYYLSALVLVIPLAVFPNYFRAISTPPLGMNVLPERHAGPWPVTLAESRRGEPYLGPREHVLKDYALHIREGYPDRIRTVYLRVGKPPNDRNLGEIMHGSPYRLHAHVRFVTPPQDDDELWLTLEEWDGTLHQLSWPVSDVVTTARRGLSKGNSTP